MGNSALATRFHFVCAFFILLVQLASADTIHNEKEPSPERRLQSSPDTKIFWDFNHGYTPMLQLPNESFTGPKTLIIQSLPPGPEEQLLDVTSRVNRAYARRWGYDYLSYIGNSPDSYLINELYRMRYTQLQHQDNTTVSDSGTFKPSPIPLSCSHPRKYDTVVVLQSDAMIVQLDFNILNLLPRSDSQEISSIENENSEVQATDDSRSLFAGGIDTHPWNVYSTVEVWNLNHSFFNTFSQTWIDNDLKENMGRASNAIVMKDLLSVLQNATAQYSELSGDDSVPLLRTIPKEMVNGIAGTVIKQERDSMSTQVVTEQDLFKIIPVIQGIADNTCYRYYPLCEIV